MYKTIIIRENIDTTIKLLKKYSSQLVEEGSMFCLVRNEYNKNELTNDFMDVIEKGIINDLQYQNTIVIPTNTIATDNIIYCVWFVKNKTKMYFNKDKIREKSIWKDVEWGKRKKNYNPKGKDPGNVWIPTEDDGKANITKHILLSDFDIYNRILSSTMCDPQDEYLLLTNESSDITYSFNGKHNIKILKSISKNNLNFNGKILNKKLDETNQVFAKVIFGTSEDMSYITDNSVKLIVTSPPYWDLKNYYKKNQIGQESYEIYSQRMMYVWKECYNKLREDGSLWININIRMRNGKPILLPKLFVNQCKKIGFKYNGIVIWHKSSGIPTGGLNLCDHHEYILIFTKSDKNSIRSFEIFDFNDYKNPKLNKKLLWNINRKAGSIGKNTIHPAIYPTEMINRIIKIASDEGDYVLDPFLGSGTSLIAALNNNRNFIGYEFNELFKDLMIERFTKEIKNYDPNIVNFLNQ